MRYFLDFKSDNYGRKVIDEPFGASGINFSLNQKPDGMGRDISFSGGEIMFEFTYLREHELKQLLYYNRKFGFESNVVLTIEIDENNKYTCDLDFATAETDDLEYFKCKGIEDAKLQIVKSRKEVKVDLFSNTDIDGNYIAPLIAENMLLLAKPVIQSSEWVSTQKFSERLETSDNRFYSINSAQNLIKTGVQGDNTFFSINSNSIKDFRVLKAEETLQNIKIKIDIPEFNYKTLVTGGGNGYLDYSFDIYYGGDLETTPLNQMKKITLLQETTNENVEVVLSLNTEVTIDSLSRGEAIYISHNFFLRQSALFGFFKADFTLPEMQMKLSVESTSYNSISKSIRLIDVMRQVVRSISGLEINAPRFESLGEFYDNRILNGNLLRGLIDKPFSISLEDIEKSIPEFKGDWEIGSDGKVFFGVEKDFYTGLESGFFDNTQFSEMSKTYNPKYSVNQLSYSYEKFQSQKENEELNSYDLIHGESKLTLFNKNVENKKEVKVKWIRDAFLIETQRRKAITITESTSSQDDEDIFCIDSITTNFDNEFTEVSILKHFWDEATQKLVIRNSGDINFISLGILFDSIFFIQPNDYNAGTYRVFSVTSSKLELTRLLGTNNSGGNGLRSTKYTYVLEAYQVPFTNYTDLGFTETSNLNSANNYSNRRYSIARNINNYWQSYLATCNLYWKDKPIKNTWYKNNGDYESKYNGIKLKENENITPKNPILSPVVYNQIVFANVAFEDYIALQADVRTNRGYIRTLDNNNTVIKVYPIDMEYSLLEMELIIKAEEKYEPTNMTISTQFDYILVNDETRIQSVIYEVQNEKLFLYDENRFRLYNGVYWFEVKVNGATPSTITQLKDWLDLLS
jgi:hypothetical protein